MYIVAVIAEKGGVGKTTIALALAVGALLEGKRPAVIDTDPQATASKWTDRREHEFPWVVPTHAARLRTAIAQAKAQGVEFLVIDTPPHAGTDAAEAARLADVVVIPIEPHLFTLETLPKPPICSNLPVILLPSLWSTKPVPRARKPSRPPIMFAASACPFVPSSFTNARPIATRAI